MNPSQHPTILAPPLSLPPARPFAAAPAFPPSDTVATVRPTFEERAAAAYVAGNRGFHATLSAYTGPRTFLTNDEDES